MVTGPRWLMRVAAVVGVILLHLLLPLRPLRILMEHHQNHSQLSNQPPPPPGMEVLLHPNRDNLHQHLVDVIPVLLLNFGGIFWDKITTIIIHSKIVTFCAIKIAFFRICIFFSCDLSTTASLLVKICIIKLDLIPFTAEKVNGYKCQNKIHFDLTYLFSSFRRKWVNMFIFIARLHPKYKELTCIAQKSAYFKTFHSWYVDRGLYGMWTPKPIIFKQLWLNCQLARKTNHRTG